jgi:hypothetical protein
MESDGSLFAHKSPPLLPALNELNPFYTIPFYFCEIQLNIVLSYMYN